MRERAGARASGGGMCKCVARLKAQCFPEAVQLITNVPALSPFVIAAIVPLSVLGVGAVFVVIVVFVLHVLGVGVVVVLFALENKGLDEVQQRRIVVARFVHAALGLVGLALLGSAQFCRRHGTLLRGAVFGVAVMFVLRVLGVDAVVELLALEDKGLDEVRPRRVVMARFVHAALGLFCLVLLGIAQFCRMHCTSNLLRCGRWSGS